MEIDIEFEKREVAEALPLKPAEVDDEWRTLKRLPDIVYKVVKGFGLQTMALWVYTVHGAKQSVHHQNRKVWVISHKELLYHGPEYNDHLRRPQDFDGKRKFIARMDSCHLTLESALDELESNRQSHLRILKETIKRSEDEIERHRKWIAECKKEQAESKPITLGSLRINLEEHVIGD